MEIWKDFNADYSVSSKGKVYSRISGRLLNPTLNATGYLTYSSYLGSVHRLVVKTFIGDIPKGLCVNHKDGDKLNNDLSNLEITTYSYNLHHAHKLGLASSVGECNSMSKLTESCVKEMYELFKLGYNNKSISMKFGVHDRYVSLIRHGHRWTHLYKETYPKSFNYKYEPETLITARNLLLEGWCNKDVSEFTGIEKSCISRIRSGKLYSEFFQVFDNSIATTIERVIKEKDLDENRVE